MVIEDLQFVRQMEQWGARWLADQPLRRYTSLGVGGTADIIRISRPDALEPVVAGLRERGIPWGVLGGGTNVLASDEPFHKIFLQLVPGPSDVIFESKDDGETKGDGNRVTISTAASLGRTVMECAKKNLGGMEGLVGVPGSVGGALRMNAGAYGTQIGPLVRLVKVFRTATGTIEELPADSIGFHYRKSSFAPDDILLTVTLELLTKPFREILDEVKLLNQRRRNSQPIKEKSAGCIFKNPPGLSTGKLIDELGMKGMRVGGAVISERHANFIVNRYEGTASDIFRLMDLVRERVWKTYSVELEEEVIVWKS